MKEPIVLPSTRLHKVRLPRLVWVPFMPAALNTMFSVRAAVALDRLPPLLLVASTGSAVRGPGAPPPLRAVFRFARPVVVAFQNALCFGPPPSAIPIFRPPGNTVRKLLLYNIPGAPGPAYAPC